MICAESYDNIFKFLDFFEHSVQYLHCGTLKSGVFISTVSLCDPLSAVVRRCLGPYA